MRRILTYGTYDLLHVGHVRLLQRARALGDFLVVGLSTDRFNALKGKRALFDYSARKEILEAVRYVDLVIPERSWDQKASDVQTHGIDILAMGNDWEASGRFEPLREYCEVVYLPRTDGISTTGIRTCLREESNSGQR